MLRTLLTRRWLAWLAFALAVAVVFSFLGRWQMHRFESRHAAQTRISRNYGAAAVPLDSVLGKIASALPVDDQWKRVELKGHYDVAHQVLIRNRPNNEVYGYEVVLPLVTAGGTRIFVDRGWVPNGPNADTPAPVPAAPAEAVTVTGWLRPSEPDLHRAPIPGQLASINVAQLGAMTGRSAYNAYVLMQSERVDGSGQAPARPQALPKPDQGMSAWINFSYALQWWAGAIAAIVFVLLRARREHLDSIGGPRPAKPKKVRVWDEEDA